MRLNVPCADCSQGRDAGSLVFGEGELDDNGVIYVECARSHKTAVIFDARRYEVLLRSGGKALLSGFANEAIASLAAALERAYEFYIRVVCRKYSVDEASVTAAWKDIASQSERQLGAFSFLYLIDNGIPLPLNARIPTIRNRVVHQGRIAKEQDAREFGELIFERIRSIERALERYPDAARAEMLSEIEAQKRTIPPGMDAATLRVETAMARDGQVIGRIETFDDYLRGLATSVKKGLS